MHLCPEFLSIGDLDISNGYVCVGNKKFYDTESLYEHILQNNSFYYVQFVETKFPAQKIKFHSFNLDYGDGISRLQNCSIYSNRYILFLFSHGPIAMIGLNGYYNCNFDPFEIKSAVERYVVQVLFDRRMIKTDKIISGKFSFDRDRYRGKIKSGEYKNIQTKCVDEKFTENGILLTSFVYKNIYFDGFVGPEKFSVAKIRNKSLEFRIENDNIYISLSWLPHKNKIAENFEYDENSPIALEIFYLKVFIINSTAETFFGEAKKIISPKNIYRLGYNHYYFHGKNRIAILHCRYVHEKSDDMVGHKDFSAKEYLVSLIENRVTD